MDFFDPHPPYRLKQSEIRMINNKVIQDKFYQDLFIVMSYLHVPFLVLAGRVEANTFIL